MSMRLAITYDISEDSNRRRVFRTLKRYGAWRQYSVFEVEVSRTERVELEDELEGLIEPDDGDRVRIYRLCQSCLDDISNLGANPPEDLSNVV